MKTLKSVGDSTDPTGIPFPITVIDLLFMKLNIFPLMFILL